MVVTSRRGSLTPLSYRTAGGGDSESGRRSGGLPGDLGFAPASDGVGERVLPPASASAPASGSGAEARFRARSASGGSRAHRLECPAVMPPSGAEAGAEGGWAVAVVGHLPVLPWRRENPLGVAAAAHAF